MTTRKGYNNDWCKNRSASSSSKYCGVGYCHFDTAQAVALVVTVFTITVLTVKRDTVKSEANIESLSNLDVVPLEARLGTGHRAQDAPCVTSDGQANDAHEMKCTVRQYRIRRQQR